MIYVYVVIFFIVYFALLCWLSISLAEWREGTTIVEIRKREAQLQRLFAWQQLARTLCQRLDQLHLARSQIADAELQFLEYEIAAAKIQNHEQIKTSIQTCLSLFKET